MQLSEGMVLGRYVVEQLLGRGGAAEVWEVRHQLLGARYALKVLSDTDPTGEAWLLHEGRVQAALAHPNLLPVRDVLTLEGRPALLMPLVSGPDLGRLLATHRPTPAESTALLQAITAGLGHAHRAGLVHRDLKPGNILLSLQGDVLQPRIADFGLVKIAGVDKTTAGVGFGTPAYAAPEQLWDAAAVDARADLFSLGVLLVELLTGQRPFAGDSIAQLIASHSTPPRLGALSGPLRALAARMLQVDPALRPSSCAEVTDALGAPDAAPLRAGGPLWHVAARLRRTPDEEVLTDASVDLSVLPDALPRHNLPAPSGTFVGRRRDLAALQGALRAQHRLLVLLGVGGTGKTRLALELARGEADREAWPGGVWFVDLSEARSLDGMLAATGRALGVPSRADAAGRIEAALQSRGRALYILDNVEQIAAHAGDLIGRWHDQAPSAVFVVTSRLPLRIGGELQVDVEPLSEAEAVALFIDRARLPLPRTDRDDLPALARALDGLPLAIELAAAHAQEVPLPEVLARLDEQRLALPAAAASAPARQQTLRATLQWSWALLTDEERAALAQCSIFEGGFTLADAEAVVALDDETVSAALSTLCEQHLLQTRAGAWSGTTRLSMLRTVQQFAAERQGEHPGLADRHARHFATLCPAPRALHRAGGDALLGTLNEQFDNLVAAMASGEAESALGCAAAATQVFIRTGPIDSGLGLLRALRRRHAGALSPSQRARLGLLEASLLSHTEGYPEALAVLDRMDEDGRSRPEAQVLRGKLLVNTSQNEAAQQLLQQVRADALRSEDRWIAAEASMLLGQQLWQEGSLQAAREIYTETLSMLVGQGDRLGELVCRGKLSNCLLYLGEVDAAREGYERTRQLAHRLGVRATEANIMACLGAVHRRCSEARRAGRCYARAVQLYEHLGDQRGADAARGFWSRLLRDRGQFIEARELLEIALESARASGDRYKENSWLSTLATIYQELGEYELAERSIERGLQLAREVGDKRSENRHHVNRARMQRRTGEPEEARAALLRALSMSEQYKDHVVEHSELGILYRELGDLDRAAQHFTQAIADAREVNILYFLGDWLAELAETRLRQGRDDVAAPLLDEAEAIMRQIDYPMLLARVLHVCAHAEHRKGDAAAAAKAIAEAQGILSALRLPPSAELWQEVSAISARISDQALS